jgi:hypothetical protein
MMFAQVYTTFNRFYCKVFLTEAIKSFFQGAARRCMVDNTSVVIARGTGKNAIPAPEMKAFGDRFGFHFEAHEKGDANRSARVEGPFYYIERNFYPALAGPSRISTISTGSSPTGAHARATAFSRSSRHGPSSCIRPTGYISSRCRYTYRRSMRCTAAS